MNIITLITTLSSNQLSATDPSRPQDSLMTPKSTPDIPLYNLLLRTLGTLQRQPILMTPRTPTQPKHPLHPLNAPLQMRMMSQKFAFPSSISPCPNPFQYSIPTRSSQSSTYSYRCLRRCTTRRPVSLVFPTLNYDACHVCEIDGDGGRA